MRASTMWSALLHMLRGVASSPAAIADTTVRPSPEEQSSRRLVLSPVENLCAVTDTGLSRDRNEDRIHVADNGALMIVADGMGGHANGALAARIAVESVVEVLTELAQTRADVDPETIHQTLRDAMNLAQRNVATAGESQAGRRMGSTLIVGLIRSNIAYLAHVGDVRGYVSSGEHLRQVTKDHSVVGELVAAGQLTDDEARIHPQKNEVLQALGMAYGLAPDINTVSLREGDRLLLCSDGLWDMLSQREIAAVLAGDGSVRQLCAQLVDRANAAGGLDNISAALFQRPPGRDTESGSVPEVSSPTAA